VVVVDLLMPGMNGVELTRGIRALGVRSRVLMLTSFEGHEYLLDALRAGANSYLLKDTAPADLVAAIEATARGESVLHPRIAAAMVDLVRQRDASQRDALTERESGVLALIADGLSNAAIAERLGIAEKTVKNHVSSVLDKLDVSDRTQAAVYAWREGLKQR
jgi:two-component system, NarL family, response regulator LiaR